MGPAALWGHRHCSGLRPQGDASHLLLHFRCAEVSSLRFCHPDGRTRRPHLFLGYPCSEGKLAVLLV